MKFSTAIVFFAFAAEQAVHAAALQPRHCASITEPLFLSLPIALGLALTLPNKKDTFPSTGGSPSWSTVRQTVNFQSNAGLSDVTSEQLRCYTTGGQRAPQIQTVAAGGSVTFRAEPAIFHPGPLQFYMAKVPGGQTAATWDGAGSVWFKIYGEEGSIANGQISWPSLNKATLTANIPKSLPSGDYLLRIEHIALHQASNTGGAQFYISCAQISVTGGGSGTPGPLVSFPGAYSANDPGIKINIYSGVRSYTPPGPAVWSG
ncbi:hypothetical protein ACEQ8H_002559 [Pleosporales sp. CAS-2024a]